MDPRVLPDDNRRPRIHPHITVRPEGRGAILFNSYRGVEAELDTVEWYITTLCDGSLSVKDIAELTGKRYGLLANESILRVRDTVEKLASAWAISMDGRSYYRFSPLTSEFSKNVPRLSAPRTVFWEVTSACNLHCRHCVSSSGHLSPGELNTREALALIDRLVRAKIFYLVITGGEPFLRHDMLDLLRYASQKNIQVKADTNGTVLDSEAIDELARTRTYSMQVSIDGIGKWHDRFRGKAGAFDAACHTIRSLVGKGIRTNLITTVTSRNIGQLDSIIDLAVDLGCRGITVNPFVPVGRGKTNTDLKLDPQGYECLYRTLYDRANELKNRLNFSSEIGFSFLFDPGTKKVKRKYMGCGVGYDVLDIGPDGTAYPCPFLHAFPLGNVMNRPLEEVWRNAPPLEPLRALRKSRMHGPCKSCDHAPGICVGGCRARAFHEYGDLMAPDPACFVQK